MSQLINECQLRLLIFIHYLHLDTYQSDTELVT